MTRVALRAVPALRGTVIGRHANGNIAVKWDNGAQSNADPADVVNASQ